MNQHQNQTHQSLAQDSESEWSPGHSRVPADGASRMAAQGAADESSQVQQLKALQAGASARNRTFQLQAGEGFAESENNTGMPDQLKTGVEDLSGMDLSDVKVHYNSDRPAQLQAHAYAQGSEIHLGPGQEEHLPHEAWHVAQQKQGRVTANTTSDSGTPVNDSPGLEKEADVMGAKAMQFKSVGQEGKPLQKKAVGGGVAQLVNISQAAVEAMLQWVGKERLEIIYPFEPVVQRYNSGFYEGYVGGDPEVDAMLWVTTVDPYMSWPENLRYIALDALKGAFMAFTLVELASNFKSFFHLWKRHEGNPNYHGDTGLIGNAVIESLQSLSLNIKFEHELDADKEPKMREFGGSKLEENQQTQSGENAEEKGVRSLAAGGELKFKDVASATTHYLKHGSFFNNGDKELGNRSGEEVEKSFLSYMREANFVVARGECSNLSAPGDPRSILKFSYAKCYAVVSCDFLGNATLLSYFPDEDQVFVNEVSQTQNRSKSIDEQNEMRMEMPD